MTITEIEIRLLMDAHPDSWICEICGSPFSDLQIPAVGLVL